nr:MAG TPA: hypothetical protein [Caudoviricetes sp.]
MNAVVRILRSLTLRFKSRGAPSLILYSHSC